MAGGITTKQMMDAPKKAIFIWINEDLHYPKSLAKSLGRRDLEIVSPYWLESCAFAGRILSGIIIDHATVFTLEQMCRLDEARRRIRREIGGERNNDYK